MKFSDTHEWVDYREDQAIIGVTFYAQDQLGDIVYVELPKVGKTVQAGHECAVLESTKAAADVYSPLSGVIVEVNTQLNDKPELINQSPENQGWLYKITLTDPQEFEKLLTEDAYKAMISHKKC
jgi:glycine cleavage system H protein